LLSVAAGITEPCSDESNKEAGENSEGYKP